VVMVMDDAQLELAVEGCLWGGFGTTGPRCTAASRVVVHEKVYEDFLEAFVSGARSLRVGNGLDPDVQVGPSVSEEQLQTVMQYIDIGIHEGARLAAGGHRLESGPYARGWFHEPTILADVDPAMRVAQEEIFGPVVSVIRCGSLDEAIAIGNGVAYGLSASIYTRNVNAAFRAMRDEVDLRRFQREAAAGADRYSVVPGFSRARNVARLKAGPTIRATASSRCRP
jgi:acyl-CoA reductase-like NAD-dependent aldehyde dehydrogenase